MLNDPMFWMGFGFGGFLFSSLAALIVARLLDRAIAEVEQDDEHWEMDTEALKAAGRFVTADGEEYVWAEYPDTVFKDNTLVNLSPTEWKRRQDAQ